MVHKTTSRMALAVALLLLGGSRGTAASWQTWLHDDFDVLDSGRWNAAGTGSVAAVGGQLQIGSGPAIGSGEQVESVASFNLASCNYALTIRCRPQTPLVDRNDSANWGFMHTEDPAYSLLHFKLLTCYPPDPEWYAEVTDQVASKTLHRRVLGNSGWEPMTEYRIEVVDGVATFFVDGDVVFVHGCPPLPPGDYRIHLNKTSPGADRYLYVDSVHLEFDAEDPDCAVARPTILMSSDRSANGSHDIWAMEPDGLWLRPLTDTPSVDEWYPRISPEGRRILATSRDSSLGSRGNGRLYLMDADGGNRREIFTNVPNKSPLAAAWSADGTRILLGVHLGPDDERHDLWSYELLPNGDAADPVPLTAQAEISQAAAPHVSPDGSLVAFSGGEVGARAGLHVVDTAGGHQYTMHVASGDPTVNLQFPRWSSDGQSLVAQAEFPGGTHQVRLVAYPGGAQDTVTAGTGHNHPTFRSDVSILFGSAWAGTPDVWGIDADGTNAAPILVDPASDQMPEYGALVLLPDEVPTAAPDAAASIVDPAGELVVYPNPNGSREFEVRYAAPRGGPVHLDVFDVAGRRIRSLGSRASAGLVRWDGTDGDGRRVTAGVYFIRLRADGGTRAKRVVIVN